MDAEIAAKIAARERIKRNTAVSLEDDYRKAGWVKSADPKVPEDEKDGQDSKERRRKKAKYRHVEALHSEPRPSCLSHDSTLAPSFLGFRNLMVLVLIIMNLRLVVENFMKYGVLICIRCHDYRRIDLILGGILYALVPCHFFVAYMLERVAARLAQKVLTRLEKNEGNTQSAQGAKAQKEFRTIWRIIFGAHLVNMISCLAVPSLIVYYVIHHPGIGTLCEVHAIVVSMKIWSYAYTNRDIRHAVLHPSSDALLPPLYKSCPYPSNISLPNLVYFWWAPTLIYQPVYPRSPRIRWSFVLKRVLEVVGLSVFIWLASAQYAAPLLRNSLDKIANLNFVSILERLMKLSTISLVIWLAGFFALFQSFLNALAEIMRFGDRNFYDDWWNSTDLKQYWSTWNKPVYYFMKRHVFSPLIGRGWSAQAASTAVFVVSGILHEFLVGIPTHNFLGAAFAGMVLQLPLIAMTAPLSRLKSVSGKLVGNCIFWLSFCIVGQPLAALMYFFAWQAKYGSVSKRA